MGQSVPFGRQILHLASPNIIIYNYLEVADLGQKDGISSIIAPLIWL